MESGMQQATEEHGAEAQESTEGTRGLVDRLRDRAYCGKSIDTLLEDAADEIERLKVVIKSYAASAKAAAEEINVLRSQVYRHRIVVVDGAVEGG